MNSAHIHLIITHLPIFGSLLGGIVLLQAFLMRSRQTELAAYTLLILSAIGAAVAYSTGEGAEELVEHLPGVSENNIELHESAATATLISGIILGLASLAGFFVALKQKTYARMLAGIILLITVVNFGLAARTGYLGGQIRHTEISGAAVNAPAEQNQAQPAGGGGEEDDD